MQMQQTHLQRAVYELGLLPCYQFENKNYYDTREVFDRHNFARDVRRNVKPEDWLFLKPRYLLTEHGIVQFAFRKNVNKLIDKFMTVMDRPLIQEMPTIPYLPRPDAPMIPAIHAVAAAQPMKFENMSPAHHHEEGMISTPADYNASWESFEVPLSRPHHLQSAQNTPGSAAATPNYAKPFTPQMMQQNGTPQMGQQSQQSQQQQGTYVSSFLSLDEPYYPAPGDNGQLKRKAVATPMDDAEIPANKRARSEEGLYSYNQSPFAQSPAQYQAY